MDHNHGRPEEASYQPKPTFRLVGLQRSDSSIFVFTLKVLFFSDQLPLLFAFDPFQATVGDMRQLLHHGVMPTAIQCEGSWCPLLEYQKDLTLCEVGVTSPNIIHLRFGAAPVEFSPTEKASIEDKRVVVPQDQHGGACVDFNWGIISFSPEVLNDKTVRTQAHASADDRLVITAGLKEVYHPTGFFYF